MPSWYTKTQTGVYTEAEDELHAWKAQGGARYIYTHIERERERGRDVRFARSEASFELKSRTARFLAGYSADWLRQSGEMHRFALIIEVVIAVNEIASHRGAHCWWRSSRSIVNRLMKWNKRAWIGIPLGSNLREEWGTHLSDLKIFSSQFFSSSSREKKELSVDNEQRRRWSKFGG